MAKGLTFTAQSDILYYIRNGGTLQGRSHWSERERLARSRLSQLLHELDVINGSLATMKRVCGKKGCRCTRGEKHESLYLAYSVKGKRRMIIIPRDRVKKVTAAIKASQRAKQLQKMLSEECFGRLMPQNRM